MPLIPGSRIGPYELVAPLGAGGMGEVYRARDSRLSRDVAIKVLRPEYANDADRLARFEREARATAALNHPNVVAIFDVGLENGQPYVVSELLEGASLRAALDRAPIPTKTAVDFAIHIAHGLAAAHRKGIVHRDIKPDNIFLTSDGRVKLLDFGVARLMESANGLPTVAGIGTTQTQATKPGVIIGTVGYMSPEQVRGEPADHRADVFALGAVLYEMVAGRRAFARQTAAETMAAILHEDPLELADGTRPVTMPLSRIIRRCLAKHPDQRFQAADDVGFSLEAIQAATDSSPGVATPADLPAAPSRALWSLTLGVIGLILGFAAARLFPPPVPEAAPSVSAIPGFEIRTFDRFPIMNARFMPDHRTIVYSAAERGYVPDLFVINPNTEGSRPLGVSNAQLLSVSSKGELAILLGASHLGQRLYKGTLARMTLGSDPRPWLEDIREADWSPDGQSLAVVHDLGGGRDRLEFPAATALYEATGYLSDPRVSPDGERVAFFEHPARFDDRGWVKVVDRAGTVRTLGGDFWALEGLAWTPDSTAVVFSGNSTGGYFMTPMLAPIARNEPPRALFAVPGRFIVHDLSADGRVLGVREDLAFGVRAKVPGESSERDLSWGLAGATAMSSDARWLLMVDQGPRGGPNYGVVLRRTDGSQTIRLGEGNPQQLSPDGKWVAAIVPSPPQLVLYPTGTGEPVRIGTAVIERQGSAAWYPDSRRLLICGAQGAAQPRCYEQELSGTPPKPVTAEGVLASLAPDGQTVLLMPPTGPFSLSTVSGTAPRPLPAVRRTDRRLGWSRDSRALFVQGGLEVPAVVERVDVSTGERRLAGRLSPEGISSVTEINIKEWSDARSYAYNYTTVPSTLFEVSGLASLLRASTPAVSGPGVP